MPQFRNTRIPIGSATTTTGTLVSLGSVPQKLMKVNVAGNTVTPVYSNICDVATGWIESQSTTTVDTSTKVYGTASLKVTSTASSGGVAPTQTINITNTKYYLVSAWGKNNNMTDIRLRIYSGNTTAVVNRDSVASSSTSWTRLGVLLSPTELSGLTQITFALRGATIAGGQFFNFDGFNIIEITATEHAQGLQPMMDKYPFIDGVESTIVNSVKVVGKNLVDKSQSKHELGTIIPATGTNTNSTNKIRNIGYLNVLPNTSYYLKLLNGYKITYIYFYSIVNSFISSSLVGNAQVNFTTPSNCYKLRYIIQNSTDTAIQLSDIDIALPQLEYGSTATTYEEYEEQTATLPSTPLTLRSIGATQDEIDILSGVYTKRIGNDGTTILNPPTITTFQLTPLLAQPNGTIVADVPTDGTSTNPNVTNQLISTGGFSQRL